MVRIYHPYWLWEDFKHDFYTNISGELKQKKIDSCLKLFRNVDLLNEYMFRVVIEWKYSCEHNLTNESLNKIAYIGQASAALYDKIPNSVTMECWSMLSAEQQKKADSIALKVLNHWYNQNKTIQLCLNMD